MKYIFGINVTEHVNNEKLDGEPLVEKEANEEQIGLLTELMELEEKINSYAPKPDRKKPIGKLCGLWAAVIAACVVITLINGSAKISDPFAILGIGLAVILGGVFVKNVLMSKAAEAPKVPEEDAAQYKTMTAKADDNAKEQFDIPDDAVNMDVLSFMYTDKDGKFKVYSKLGISIYLNNPKKVFIRDGKMYFADLTSLFAIPVDTLGEPVLVDKTVNLPWWNKENPYNSAKYAEYKIHPNNIGTLSMKTYYAIPLKANGEDYTLCIPPYEKEVYDKLIEKH